MLIDSGIPRSWRSAAGKPWFVGTGGQRSLAGLSRHYDQERGAEAGRIGREEPALRAVWGKQKQLWAATTGALAGAEGRWRAVPRWF